MMAYVDFYFINNIRTNRNHIIKIKYTDQFPICIKNLMKINIIFHCLMFWLWGTKRNTILFVITDNNNSYKRTIGFSGLWGNGKYMVVLAV